MQFKLYLIKDFVIDCGVLLLFRYFSIGVMPYNNKVEMQNCFLIRINYGKYHGIGRIWVLLFYF